MKLIEDVKSDSSYWIKTKGQRYQNFYWQSRYGAFSVSPSEVESIKKYIEDQHEHHRSEGFQDEYRGILRKNRIEFDERYLWDQDVIKND